MFVEIVQDSFYFTRLSEEKFSKCRGAEKRELLYTSLVPEARSKWIETWQGKTSWRHLAHSYRETSAALCGSDCSLSLCEIIPSGPASVSVNRREKKFCNTWKKVPVRLDNRPSFDPTNETSFFRRLIVYPRRKCEKTNRRPTGSV